MGHARAFAAARLQDGKAVALKTIRRFLCALVPDGARVVFQLVLVQVRQALRQRRFARQIRLALVSIPVEVYSATRSGATIAFHQIYEPTGQRIKYEKVAPGVGPVDVDKIVKGFEYEKGEYVLLDEKEIEGVKLESKKTLELTQFVDSHDIDPIYFEKPYYLVPADDLAEEAFIVLREALRRTHKIGLGQLAMRGREYVVSIKACGRGPLPQLVCSDTCQAILDLRQAQVSLQTSHFRLPTPRVPHPAMKDAG